MGKLELIKISNNEHQIGENKLYFPEQNILFIESNGDNTDETAEVYNDFYLGLVENITGKKKIIVDINNSKKSTTNARKTWKNIGGLEKTGKVALFGLHPVAKLLAAFVIRFANKKKSVF